MTHIKKPFSLFDYEEKYSFIKILTSKWVHKEKNRNAKPSPHTGKVSTDRLTEGAGVSRNERRFWPVYAPLPLSPRFARHFPRRRGQHTAKEKRNYSFYYLSTLLKITHAGFFAYSDNLFFLLLSFLFCSPLKNDGRGELRFREAVNDFCLKRKV